jgi:hypothetical protein
MNTENLHCSPQASGANRLGIVQIVPAMPAAMQAVILTAVFILTKLCSMQPKAKRCIVVSACGWTSRINRVLSAMARISSVGMRGSFQLTSTKIVSPAFRFIYDVERFRRASAVYSARTAGERPPKPSSWRASLCSLPRRSPIGAFPFL